jgi:hypothetical protein
MPKNQIILKNYLSIFEEIQAGGAITPGHLIEVNSSGYVVVHATAGGNAAPIMVALEDELQGKEIGDAYASGNKVRVWIPQRGDQAYMLLKDGENVSIGDKLESAGNGTLQKHVADVESFESKEPGSITVYPNQIVGAALEALDLSGSSGDESSGLQGAHRIQVRIV